MIRLLSFYDICHSAPLLYLLRTTLVVITTFVTNNNRV
jgi:hypothetical protein